MVYAFPPGFDHLMRPHTDNNLDRYLRVWKRPVRAEEDQDPSRQRQFPVSEDQRELWLYCLLSPLSRTAGR